MTGTASEALRHALMLFSNPALVEPHRRAPVPDGMGELLRAACGQVELLAEQGALLGVPAEELEDAARFYVEQMLLSREVASDPWRVLGAERGAPGERLREHRQLLLRLVHPDRSSDWAEAYADRVQRAWRELKNGGPAPEPRAEGDRPASDDWEVPAASAWEPVAPQPLHVEELPHHQGMSPRSKWGLGGVGVLLLGLMLWGPQLEDALRGDDLQVLGGYTESDPGFTEQDGDAATPLQASPSQGDATAQSPQEESPMSSLAYPDPQIGETLGSSVSPAPETPPRPAVASARTPARHADIDRQQPDLPAPVTAQPASPGRATPTEAQTAVPRAASREDARRDVSAPATARADQAAPIERSPKSPSAIAQGGRDAPQSPTAAPSPVPSAETVVAIRSESAPSARAEAQPEPQTVKRQASVGDAAVAVATPAGSRTSPVVPSTQTRPSLDQADAALGHFRRYYAAGDLGALLGLFADNANSKRGGIPALRADYSALFGSTDSREIDFIDVRWQVVRDSLQGQGRFEVRLGRKGRYFKQKVSGRVNLEVVQTTAGPKLNRLEPVQEG
ncbi:MAG: hypothetical protein KDJ14_15275 [Xanthomonadales bacterium]|nr:hypothetical protein [Xanthomonadales bacterium]